MMSMTREMLLTMITTRTDTALNRLGKNTEYSEVSKRQATLKKEIEKLFDQLGTEENTIFESYDEGEMYKETFKNREVYLQGVRDCFKLLAILNDTQDGVQI